MSVLVVGASGATGRLLVKQLLDRGVNVKAIVRAPDKLPSDLRTHPRLELIAASLLDLSHAEMAAHVGGCEAIASCLGHNLTLRGLFGKPRLLVTDATRRLCDTVQATRPAEKVRFVLMNTAGNGNRGVPERVSFSEKCVIAGIRVLLPPHRDNENAAEYLRATVGERNDAIEWSVVRPDTLIDETEVTAYDVYPSPTRSAIFNAGKTSRINVGHFMADLMTDDSVWNRWKGRMPVIYNRTAAPAT